MDFNNFNTGEFIVSVAVGVISDGGPTGFIMIRLTSSDPVCPEARVNRTSCAQTSYIQF